MGKSVARSIVKSFRLAKCATTVTSIITIICFCTCVTNGQGFSGYAVPSGGTTPVGQSSSQPANGGAPSSDRNSALSPPTAQTPQSSQLAVPQGGTPSGGYITNPVPNRPAAQPAQIALLPPPFTLSENDQFRLNEFLSHWEKFGKGIKRVACNVHVREFDGGVFNKNSNVPMSHTWGQFRYISPNKLFYHIRGEYTYIAKAGEDPKPEWKVSSNESKIVYDGKSLTQYDYRKKMATVFPLVEEEWNDDLSMDGPFPLFFVANAAKLRERFYMRIVTPQDKVETDVWIEAFPRYPGDAQEFKSIIVLLKLADLQPYHLRRTRINGKSYSDLEFQDVTINKGFWNIESTLDLGWKKTTEGAISLRQRRNEGGSGPPPVVTPAPVPTATSPGHPK